MPIVKLDQSTPEWHAWRKGKLSASKAGIILGLSPYQTPRELWEEEIGLRDPQPSSLHMQAGLDIEDEAREWFWNKMRLEMKPACFEYSDNPLFIASLDGISGSRTTILEIKKNGKEFHELARSGKVLPLYNAQMQHQMYVTGLDECYYLSYRKGDEILLNVGRDELFITEMIEKELAFKRLVDDLISPELIERDYEDMSYNTELQNLAYRYTLKNDLIKQAEKERCELKNQIKEIVGDKKVKCAAFKINRYKIDGRVDYERIMNDHCPSVSLESYRKEPSYAYRISTDK